MCRFVSCVVARSICLYSGTVLVRYVRDDLQVSTPSVVLKSSCTVRPYGTQKIDD
jgi:hypothetical protein